MIFPGQINRKELTPKLSLAWVVVATNILIYLAMNLTFTGWPQKASYHELQAKNFNRSLSEMYLQSIDPIEKKQLIGVPTEEIATKAIRDSRFWSRSAKYPFVGDQVQISQIRKLLFQLKNDYQSSVQYQFGLGAEQTSPWAWVTYQFTHYSFVHLISNLVFLFLIIAYLEKKIASGWLAAVYLLGGIGGGVGFLYFNGDADLSVIGASGSVCALLSFLLVIKTKDIMPWVYFVAPVPKAYGEIFLPVALILPVYLISDFSSMLFEPTGITTTIAHSAHVGGTITGFLLGGLFLVERFVWSKSAAHGVFSDHDGLDKLF